MFFLVWRVYYGLLILWKSLHTLLSLLQTSSLLRQRVPIVPWHPILVLLVSCRRECYQPTPTLLPTSTSRATGHERWRLEKDGNDIQWLCTKSIEKWDYSTSRRRFHHKHERTTRWVELQTETRSGNWNHHAICRVAYWVQNRGQFLGRFETEHVIAQQTFVG